MPDGIRESLRKLREERRPAQGGIRDSLAQLRAERQQQPQGESNYEWLRRNVGIAGRGVWRDIKDAVATGSEVVGGLTVGDLRPAGELLERAGRGAVQTATSLFGEAAMVSPEFGGTTLSNEEVKAVVERAKQENARGIAEAQARQAARRGAATDAEYWRGSETERARIAAEEAADPALSSRLVRGGVRALPYVGAAVASGGSIPAMAGTAGFMSLAEPEGAALNVGLSVLPAPPVKFVAPVLRRIRAGRGAASAAESGAVSRVNDAVENAARAEAGLPELEADFGISAATRGSARSQGVSARGPAAESAAFDVGADPALATKAERTKVLEIISAARKAGLLSSVKTHLRNVGGTGLFQLSEEVSRIPGALVDALVSRVTKQRTLTGPSLDSMQRSFHEAATKGWSEAKEIWRKGVTQADIERLGLNQEVNSGSKILDTYINRTFRLLSAEDKLFHTFAARRALEDRAKALALTEIRRGKIPRADYARRFKEILEAPPEDLAAAAAADAEIAVFTNDNLVSKFLAAGGREVEKLPGGRGATFALDMIFPFVKTPTNVIARMLDYAGLGAARESTRAIARRIVGKSMTAEQQRAFAQAWGRAGVGAGLVALGYIGHRDGWLTGFIEDDLNRRERDEAAGRIPGAIKIGGGWHQIIGAAPLASLLIVGATLGREVSQEREGSGLLPVLETLGQSVGEAPLLIGSKQVAESLTKPGTTGERLLGGLIGSFVPTGVSDIAEALDPAQRETRGAGVTGAAQKRIPGLRQTLPQAVDVLGVPRQDFGPGQAMLDPTRATTDIARQNPLLGELVRLDLGLSGIKQKPDENAGEFRARTQEFGRLYLNYGALLVDDPQYRVSNDATKRRVLATLNRVIKQQLRDDDEGVKPGKLAAPALLDSLRRAEERKRQKELEQERRRGHIVQ